MGEKDKRVEDIYDRQEGKYSYKEDPRGKFTVGIKINLSQTSWER